MKNINLSPTLPRLFVLIVSVFYFTSNINGQEGTKIKDFNNFFEVHEHKHNWTNQLKDNDNEINLIFSGLFVLYKELISSQDVDACVMTPTCSVYAIENIKKNGLFFGLLNAFDRLTRCNPGKHKDLPIDVETGKYYDPVD
jgi:putative component of membrane protein insertase Oxa1/YidC/SpoIIIJ protein YidD